MGSLRSGCRRRRSLAREADPADGEGSTLSPFFGQGVLCALDLDVYPAGGVQALRSIDLYAPKLPPSIWASSFELNVRPSFGQSPKRIAKPTTTRASMSWKTSTYLENATGASASPGCQTCCPHCVSSKQIREHSIRLLLVPDYDLGIAARSKYIRPRVLRSRS